MLPKNDMESQGTKMPDWYIRPYRRVDQCLWSKPDVRLKNIITGYEQVNVIKKVTEPAVFYPETCTALTFYCGPGTPSVFFTGAMTQPIHFTDVKPGIYFVIVFSPGKMYSVTSIPLNEFQNAWVSIDDILTPNFHYLSEQLSMALSFQDRIRIWESYFKPDWMENERGIPVWVNNALSMISKKPNYFKDKKLAAFTGYTIRHTRDVFKRYAGITPKDFRRISRYKLGLYHLTTNPAINCAGLAYELGYADQAHFINEFKRFHGSTPTQFIKEFL